jgi:transcriptional regulator with XRE-family HTH domain
MHKLTAARLDRGLNIQQLSEKAGVRAATISRIEHSHTEPRAGTLWKLSKVLGVRPSQLVGEADASDVARAEEPTGEETPEEAADAIAKMSDQDDVLDYARLWAGEDGADALIRLDALSKALPRWEKPVHYWSVRALFYGLGRDMATNGEVSEEALTKVGG